MLMSVELVVSIGRSRGFTFSAWDKAQFEGLGREALEFVDELPDDFNQRPALVRDMGTESLVGVFKISVSPMSIVITAHNERRKEKWSYQIPTSLSFLANWSHGISFSWVAPESRILHTVVN